MSTATNFLRNYKSSLPGKSQLFIGLIVLALFLLVQEKTKAQVPNWLWAKSIGSIGSDHAQSIAVDPESGDIYTAGSFQGTVDFDPGEKTYNLSSDGSSDIFITKFDRSGNFIWAKVIGGPNAAFVTTMTFDNRAGGNVYIAGSFNGLVDFDPGDAIFSLNSPGNVDIFIIKLTGSGKFIWAKAVGGLNVASVLSLKVDPSGNGNIYTTGYFRGTVDFDPDPLVSFNLTSNGDLDIFISKLDNSGNLVWAKQLGGSGSDESRSIAIDPTGSGDVYTTGWFSGTIDFDPGPNSYNITSVGRFDIFISKIDSSGNFVWAKQIGGAGTKDGAGASIAIDPERGDVYTTGYFEGTADFDPDKGIINLNSSGHRDIFISKLDSSGNFIWAKAIGGTGPDVGGSIVIDPAGIRDIYISGIFSGLVDFDPGDDDFNLTSAGKSDIFISKLDSSGNFEWAKEISVPKGETAGTIALDASGYLYVGGFFNGPTISYDAVSLTNADTTRGTADIFIAKLNLLTTSTIKVDSKSDLIDIYPNPTKDLIKIKFNKENFYNVKITMYTVSGKIVFSNTKNTISKEESIDVSAFPSGIYFVGLDYNGYRKMVQVVKVQE